MSFDLKKYTPYELNKRNVERMKNDEKPSPDEYRNLMQIINTDLSKEQYEQLYTLFIMNLEKKKVSKTSTGIRIDIQRLDLDEFYRLENIICDFIYELKRNSINETKQIESQQLTPDCDYSAINKDLYVDESIEIKTEQPIVSNYLELYDIQRSLPSLKKE